MEVIANIMDFLINNPLLISFLVEFGIIIWFCIRLYMQKLKLRMGTLYRCRMCEPEGALLRQRAEKLVQVGKSGFRYKKQSYVVMADRVLLKDPAPMLVYKIGNASPMTLEEIKLMNPMTPISSEMVDDYTEGKAVEQIIRSSIKQKFDPMQVGVGIGIGVIVMYILQIVQGLRK